MRLTPKLNRLVLTGILSSVMSGACLADDLEGIWMRAVLERSQRHVLQVDFSARIELEGLPGVGVSDTERTARGTLCGVLVHDKRHIVASATGLAPGAAVYELLGATPRTRFVKLVARLGGGVKVAARLVATNTRLGLSLLSLESDAEGFEPVSFAEDALSEDAFDGAPKAPLIGRIVALAQLSSPLLGAPRSVCTARVSGLAERPFPLMILSPAQPEARGALAFCRGFEQAIGIHAPLPLAQLPATKKSVGRRTFEPHELATAARGYVIPGGAIRAWYEAAIARPKASAAPLVASQRSWLGLDIQVITEELGAALGIDYDGIARVRKIYPGTPAATAGLAKGDLIITLDEESLELAEGESMRDLVSDLGVDETVTLGVLRGEQQLSFELKLAASPPSPEEVQRFPSASHGLVIRDVCFFDSAYDPERSPGVLVIKVAKGGEARFAGLTEGMLLTHIGDQAVPDVATARALIRAGVALEVTVAKPAEGAEAQPTKLRIRGR